MKVISEVTEEFLGGLPITLNPNGEALYIENGIIYFDDIVYLKQTRSARVESFTVYYSEYINGIEISYYIGSVLKTLCHATTAGKKARIDFFLSEAIAEIACTYGETGLHSLSLMTTDGRSLEAVGSVGLGRLQREVKMTESMDIVGFYGAINSHLVSLTVYLVKAEDASEPSYSNIDNDTPM